MWADRAAYYSHLPYLFEADQDVNKLLSSLDTNQVGRPFKIDERKSAMVNKYPVGVAMLQAPFYLAGIAAEYVFKKPPKNYFQGLRIRFVEVSAPFYVAVGLILLYLFLAEFGISTLARLMALSAILFGSSLYYYTVMEGTMSHAYSFFLFSAFNFVFWRLVTVSERWPWKLYVLLGLIIAGILLVRPFNAVLLGINALVLTSLAPAGFLPALKKIMQGLVVILPILVICAIPQLLYYKHAYGSFFVYSYGYESFKFQKPELIKSLVNPRAGMLIYTPLFVVLILSTILVALKRPQFWLLLVLFLGMFYVNSSWWSWHFGCGFGLRPYVEWMPILVLPMAVLLQDGRQLKWLLPVLFLVSYYTFEMSYRWTGCWFHQPETLEVFMKRFWT